MDNESLTQDGFLGGRLRLWQPCKGYRAGTDAVLLAAAVPAQSGQRVLELGCGAGAAALCLMQRVPGLTVSGLEAQAMYAALALRNAKENGLELAVHEGRIEAMPAPLKAESFDQILANPPYFETFALTAPQSNAKKIAHEMPAGALSDWIDAGRKRLLPGGTFTLINRTEALAELLAALREGFGDIDVIPIASRSARAAERVILRARKGRKGPLTLHPPLIMHAGPAHSKDGNDYSPAAEDILAGGGALH